MRGKGGEETAMNVLPERLKTIRKQRGWTQRQVAQKMNISPSTIALYETGDRNPDPLMLTRLADFLDCSVDWLLGRVTMEEIHQLKGTFNLEQPNKEILAAHRSDDPTRELPAEARQSLNEFKEYIMKKYGKKK
ncbi:MAG: helix-turn-helix domain-containing protein [Desulfitobacteriaceae bacterium]|nr:helix-turn-helix domain-containing protein [Desulfitobacteriaceae bacterium]